MNLGQFIDTFKEAIAQRVVESYPPLYRPSENGGKMPRLLRKPLGAQADAIRGAALSLEAHRGTTVVGEMGNCLEAFEFYRYVFGSDFDLISTFGEGPPDIGMSDDERDRYAGPDGSQIRREDT